MHQMRKKDVTFRLGEAVARVEIFEEGRPEVELELESGKRIIADCVLFSIGRRSGDRPAAPRRVRAWRRTAGAVFRSTRPCRTNVPNIYAAGDVVGFPALAATSSEQGPDRGLPDVRLSRRRTSARLYPYGIYAVPEISMCGATEEQLTPRPESRTRSASPATGRRPGARSSATTPGRSRCSSTGKVARPSRRALHRHERDGAGAHRPGRHLARWRTRLLHEQRVQLPDAGRGLQDRGPQCGEPAAARAGPAAEARRGNSRGPAPVVSAEVPDRDDPRPNEEPPPAGSRTTERTLEE